MSNAASGGPALALTIGEPAGIGPDIAIEAWLARTRTEVPPFLYVGPSSILQQRAVCVGRSIRTAEANAADAPAIFETAIPCLNQDGERVIEAGTPDAANARLVIGSIETAAKLVHAGECAAMVTNPIHKKVLADAGFGYPGHTEYLGALARTRFGTDCVPVMMLAAPGLKVVPVTIHIALRDVFQHLTTEVIVEAGRIVAADLASRFGIEAARLAVAGLNPHAGEGGLMGDEDAAIIRPAVKQLNALGIDARGPLPADTMFHKAARQTYDAALCMYHDQALIPVKTLAFDTAVNVTLGLPFIRTSPDHGTAIDIAGSGKADPSSLIAALQLAEKMSRRQIGR